MATGFKFNFFEPGEGNCVSDSEAGEREHVSADGSVLPDSSSAISNGIRLQAREITPTSDLIEKQSQLLDAPESLLLDDGTVIRFCSPKQVEARLSAGDHATLSESAAVFAHAAHTDLIPSVYEGGLKIWECSFDLLHFMVHEGFDFDGKRVLELGCGSGLPGLYALLRGAHVDFQDYNAEVLELVTIPNAYLNVRGTTDDVRALCHFYCGDWETVAARCLGAGKPYNKYDMILTAETIYNPKSYETLHSVFNRLLSDEGHVYVAAKSYYFGVGGCTEGFRRLVEEAGAFTVSAVVAAHEGVPREILRLRRASGVSQRPTS